MNTDLICGNCGKMNLLHKSRCQICDNDLTNTPERHSEECCAPLTGYVADHRYYVKDSAGAYIVGVGNGATWWGNKARAIPFEKREAELRAKRGFYTDGSQQGSIEEAPATLRVDFTKPHNVRLNDQHQPTE